MYGYVDGRIYYTLTDKQKLKMRKSVFDGISKYVAIDVVGIYFKL